MEWLYAYARLVAGIGGFLILFSLVIFVLPHGLDDRRVSSIADEILRKTAYSKSLLSDMKDPRMVAGGLVGLCLRMAIIGLALLLVGGVLWLVSRLG